jgi:tetratricopeptide (TPR) repeat protein
MWHAYVHEEGSDQSAALSSRTTSPKTKQTETYESGELTARVSEMTQPTEEETHHLNLHKAVRLMWTDGLLEAERWLYDRRTSDLKCAHHYAEAGMLKSFLFPDSQLRSEALQRISTALEKASKFSTSVEAAGSRVLDLKGAVLNPKEAINLIKAAQQLRLGCVIQAELLLFQAGSELASKTYIKGSLDFRKSWKLYQRVQKLSEAQKTLEQQYFTPEELRTKVSTAFEDDIANLLSFGLGVIYTTLSMAPPSVARLAKLGSGMESSMSMGQALLYECVYNPTGLRMPLAVLFILFWLLIYIPDFVPGKEERHREANKLAKSVLRSHSKSIYFYWVYAYLKQKQGDTKRTLGLLQKALNTAASIGFENPPPRLVFEKGWAFFLCQDWQGALELFSTSLNAEQPSQFSLLLIGLCHCMLGDLRTAEKALNKVASPQSNISSTERWIKRRAESFLQRRWFQLFPYEILYVTDTLPCMKAPYFEDLLAMLDQIEIDPPNKDSKDDADEFAILQLLKGTSLRYCGRLQEAIEVMTTALSYKHLIRRDQFVVAHLSYEVGMIYVKGRDWATAKQHLQQAKAYKKSDFSNGLRFKLKSALEHTAKEECVELKRLNK